MKVETNSMCLLLTFIAWLCFSASVALGGGAAGCMERVLAWQAFEIDGLRAEADQTIGFRCAKWEELDGKTKVGQCKDGKWELCKIKGKRCDFDQFLRSLGKHPGGKGWKVLRPDGKLDIDATAKKCLDVHKNRNQAPFNFPSSNVIKDTKQNLHQVYVLNLAKAVDDAVRIVRTAEAKEMAGAFDMTRKRILELRIGDHGVHVIEKARASLEGQMEIRTKDVGASLEDKTKQLQTVDWTATARGAIDNFMDGKTVERTIHDYVVKFYDDDKSAKDHRAVIVSYKVSANRSRRCRV